VRKADVILVGNDAPKMSRCLPQALGATGLVVAAPVVAVWALRAWQVVGSTAGAIAIGVVLSLAVSFAGSAYWASRESSRDILFSELMIWGWLRRWRAEHQLTAALERLAQLTNGGATREATPQLSMLKELAAALEAGDPYTRNHSRRVARYASMIAERLGLPAEEVDRIRTAAAVHDVGKVRTPIEVLHKPGRLTDEEYMIIKAHPVDGARLVEALGDERLTAIVRHHHERLDGRGYPSGLRGDEIPIGARIIAVADTFDAVTSARPYRPASPHRKALDILTKEAGTQLDADAVRAFRACYTGRRPLALWMTLLAFPQRVSASLGSGPTASAVSITKVVAASTVAVAGGAAASARPLMVAASPPRATAVPTAVVGPQSSSSPRATSASRVTVAAPAATPTASTAPTTRTRDQSLLRRSGTLSRHFPSSTASHRAARRSAHAGSPPVSTASPGAPVTSSSSTASPVSTSSGGPVSTIAAAPTTTSTTKTTSTTAPASSGSTTSTGTTHAPTTGHGHGSGGSGKGNGHGHGNGNGTGSTPTATTPTTTTTTTTPTTPTTPTATTTTPTTTTTTPVADPPGNGNGNGNGNANGHGNAGGNGDGDGNAGGNGHGKANGHAASAPSGG
jgi:putative nucleotidyltransferase with HDIG domain